MGPHRSGRNEPHEDHQGLRHPHVGARAQGEAPPHRPRHQGQERRDAHPRRDRQRAHRHRRGARLARRSSPPSSQHELAPEVVGEDPMFSERIYEKMYNGSRSTPALERGVTQADESRRRGVIMEAICRRRHRGVGREGAGARHPALPGAGRGAQLGARLCQRRLGARRGGRSRARGLRGQGLHRRQDARGRPRRLLDRQVRAPREGGPPRASAPASS